MLPRDMLGELAAFAQLALSCNDEGILATQPRMRTYDYHGTFIGSIRVLTIRVGGRQNRPCRVLRTGLLRPAFQLAGLRICEDICESSKMDTTMGYVGIVLWLY